MADPEVAALLTNIEPPEDLAGHHDRDQVAVASANLHLHPQRGLQAGRHLESKRFTKNRLAAMESLGFFR